jgi:hypothetical protein
VVVIDMFVVLIVLLGIWFTRNRISSALIAAIAVRTVAAIAQGRLLPSPNP